MMVDPGFDDGSIRAQILGKLRRSRDVDAQNITVHVENGEVTLEGTVADRHHKREAEDCCHEVYGVRQVHNLLRVQDNGDEDPTMGLGQNAPGAEQGMQMGFADGAPDGMAMELDRAHQRSGQGGQDMVMNLDDEKPSQDDASDSGSQRGL